MKKLLLFGVFVFVNLTGVSADELQRQLDSLLNLYQYHNNFKGTVMVARKGEVLFAKGFGYANREHQVPNSAETKFRIASITKQFTAMLVLQQVAEGKLLLDVPIRAYIPDYPSPQGDIITIHHLLAHTSGMPHYAGIPDFFDLYGRKSFTHREFVELFWGLELLFAPGEKYSYSSFGYYLLGYILEITTKKDFDDLLRERILEPLGMINTGIVDHRKVKMNKASGYDMVLNGFQLAEFRDLSTALATGDMFTTVLDMILWDHALREYKLLDKKWQDKMFTPNLSNYGYGWVLGYSEINENDSVKFQQHTGGTNGFSTIGTRLPEDGYYILVFCNTRPGQIRPVEQDIIRILYGNQPEFRPSTAIAAARILEESGIEASLKFIRSIYNKNSEEATAIKYELSFPDISRIGFNCLRLDRVSDAISFFELGTELFPDSYLAWTALGEGYRAAEKKGKAIAAFARALVINPEHDAALERLKLY